MDDAINNGTIDAGGSSFQKTFLVHTEHHKYDIGHRHFPLVAWDARLTFAMDLLRSGTANSAIPDGEDTSGRAKMRVVTPAEAVSRAMEIAETLFERGWDKGWVYGLDGDAIAKIENMDSDTFKASVPGR